MRSFFVRDFLALLLLASTSGVAASHVFAIPAIRDDEILRWILARVTANGLSSARRLLLPDGSEDLAGSQRVEFRVKTSAEDQLSKILGALAL
jgi:hypothetical protein